MSTSAAAKRIEKIDEILNSSTKAKATTQTKEVAKENAYADIKSNPFYGILFSPTLSPEEKKKAVAKTWVATGDKKKDREVEKAFEIFKEYLQSIREEMSVKIIKYTDTETFSELKQVYEDLNNALIDFDDKMNPLTEIIDAIYSLRTNGVAFDAFKEIQQDRMAEETAKAERERLATEIELSRSRLNDTSYEINRLRNQRSLFGFGGVKPEALEEIARKEVELDNIRRSISDIETKIASGTVQNESQLGEFAAQKEKLRELLDITSDEHKQRQNDLVSAALNFVKTAKDRVGSVRHHLDKMNDQVSNLGDATGHMAMVYATLNEGLKEAEKENHKQREALIVPEGTEEDLITKMQREEKKAAIEQHLTALDRSTADTIMTYGDLVSQSTRIKTMKDANDTQITKARNMYTQGVAGVADRLSVVLQAVSAAALGESSSMASETLSRMASNTNKVAQKESIRIAMGISEQNSDIDKAMADLAQYGEITKQATSITREGITEMREKLQEMERIAREVNENVSESIAVHADVGAGTKARTSSTKVEEKVENPFGL